MESAQPPIAALITRLAGGALALGGAAALVVCLQWQVPARADLVVYEGPLAAVEVDPGGYVADLRVEGQPRLVQVSDGEQRVVIPALEEDLGSEVVYRAALGAEGTLYELSRRRQGAPEQVLISYEHQAGVIRSFRSIPLSLAWISGRRSSGTRPRKARFSP